MMPEAPCHSHCSILISAVELVLVVETKRPVESNSGAIGTPPQDLLAPVPAAHTKSDMREEPAAIARTTHRRVFSF
jgi:hypothetical protein